MQKKKQNKTRGQVAYTDPNCWEARPWVLYLMMISLISPNWTDLPPLPRCRLSLQLWKVDRTTSYLPSLLQLPWGHCLHVWLVTQTKETGVCLFYVLNGMPPRKQNMVDEHYPQMSTGLHSVSFCTNFKFQKCKQSFLYTWSLFFQMEAICNMIQLPLPLSTLLLSSGREVTTTMVCISSLPVELLQTQWLSEAKPGCGKILQFNKTIIKPHFSHRAENDYTTRRRRQSSTDRAGKTHHFRAVRASLHPQK